MRACDSAVFCDLRRDNSARQNLIVYRCDIPRQHSIKYTRRTCCNHSCGRAVRCCMQPTQPPVCSPVCSPPVSQPVTPGNQRSVRESLCEALITHPTRCTCALRHTVTPLGWAGRWVGVTGERVAGNNSVRLQLRNSDDVHSTRLAPRLTLTYLPPVQSPGRQESPSLNSPFRRRRSHMYSYLVCKNPRGGCQVFRFWTFLALFPLPTPQSHSLSHSCPSTTQPSLQELNCFLLGTSRTIIIDQHSAL